MVKKQLVFFVFLNICCLNRKRFNIWEVCWLFILLFVDVIIFVFAYVKQTLSQNIVIPFDTKIIIILLIPWSNPNKVRKS